jgi:hypothetical protein
MAADCDIARVLGGRQGLPGDFPKRVFDAASGRYFELVSRDRALAAWRRG